MEFALEFIFKTDVKVSKFDQWENEKKTIVSKAADLKAFGLELYRSDKLARGNKLKAIWGPCGGVLNLCFQWSYPLLL